MEVQLTLARQIRIWDNNVMSIVVVNLDVLVRLWALYVALR
jgi:hypothetical protein